MPNVAISRKVDDLGRVVIPSETRKLLGIKERDALAISVEDGRIIFEKMVTECVVCGSRHIERTYKSKPLCAACVSGISGHEGA